MPMRSALYYPHTRLGQDGSELLKRALLLWDDLEFIVPFPDYSATYKDRVVAEAVELIGRKHCPDEEEQQQAHDDIEELVTRPRLPEAFFYQVASSEIYGVYPQKFLEKTWEMLSDSKLAGSLLPNANLPVSPVTGLCIMSILADACAGTTRVRVTDRPGAYASIAGLLGSDAEPDKEAQIDETRGRIVAVTLKLLDLENVSLSSLVDLRKREEKSSGHALRDLRHRYSERIEAHLKEISVSTLTKSDIDVLDRQFASDTRDDLAQLQSELKSEFKQALWSKDVIVSLIAGAGTVATIAFGAPLALAGVVTAAGAPATIGGVFASRGKFLKSRAELMRKHPLAYLYEARGGLQL